MITILLILIWLFLSYKSIMLDIRDMFQVIVVPIMMGFITTLFIFLTLSFAAGFGVETHRDECRANIYSLKNTQGFEGRFCLGSGYIGSLEYYYMFQKVENGGLARVHLRPDDCIIFQNEENNPNVYWQRIHYRFPKWALLWPAVPLDSKDTKYNINIPSNSVVQQFKID